MFFSLIARCSQFPGKGRGVSSRRSCVCSANIVLRRGLRPRVGFAKGRTHLRFSALPVTAGPGLAILTGSIRAVPAPGDRAAWSPASADRTRSQAVARHQLPSSPRGRYLLRLPRCFLPASGTLRSASVSRTIGGEGTNLHCLSLCSPALRSPGPSFLHCLSCFPPSFYSRRGGWQQPLLPSRDGRNHASTTAKLCN